MKIARIQLEMIHSTIFNDAASWSRRLHVRFVREWSWVRFPVASPATFHHAVDTDPPLSTCFNKMETNGPPFSWTGEQTITLSTTTPHALCRNVKFCSCYSRFFSDILNYVRFDEKWSFTMTAFWHVRGP